MTGTVAFLGEAPERAGRVQAVRQHDADRHHGRARRRQPARPRGGHSTAEAFALFKQFNPGQMLPARAARIESGDVTKPSFEVAMARKDVRLMIEEARPRRRRAVRHARGRGDVRRRDRPGEGALDAAVAARIPG
jgi:hypothetical protein